MKNTYLFIYLFLGTLVSFSQDYAGVKDSTFSGTGEFNIHPPAGYNFYPKNIIYQNNKIYLFGLFTNFNNTQNIAVLSRLNADGTKDLSYNNGKIDTLWAKPLTYGMEMVDILLDPQGNFLLYGKDINFHSLVIRKFKSTGGLDKSFGTNGVLTVPLTNAFFDISKGILDSQGRYVFVCSYQNSMSAYDVGTFRLKSDFTIDPTYGNNGEFIIPQPVWDYEFCTYIKEDNLGRYYLHGQLMYNSTSTSYTLTYRLKSDGRLDSSFASQTNVMGSYAPFFGANISDPGNFYIDANNVAYVGGTGLTSGGQSSFSFTRINPTGQPDYSFNTNTNFAFSDFCDDILVDSKGRAIMVGVTTDFAGKHHVALLRTAVGHQTLDNEFGSATGKTLLLSNTNFDSNGKFLALDNNDNIFVFGNYTDNFGVVHGMLFKLTANPGPKITFSSNTTLSLSSSVYGSGSSFGFYNLSGRYLTDSLVVESPDGLIISSDFSNYSKRVAFAPDASGSVNTVNIAVKTDSSSQAGLYNLSIINKSKGAVTKNKPVLVDITKKILTVQCDSAKRAYGELEPSFTYKISGFVNKDTVNAIDTLPVAYTEASRYSNVGKYLVKAHEGYDVNYAFNFLPDTLRISKALNNTSFINPSVGVIVGDADFYDSLNVYYQGLTSYDVFNGNSVTINSSGRVSIVKEGISIIRAITNASMNFVADTAYATIAVYPYLVPPTAKDDTVDVKLGDYGYAKVLANDTAYIGKLDYYTVDLDPTTAVRDTLFTQYDRGVYLVDSSGLVTFRPLEGFLGIAELRYSFRDTRGTTSSTATIYFRIYNPDGLMPLLAPEIITPNGDGKNDYFFIRYADNTLPNRLFIYDRHGYQVYSANDYKNNWDGKNDGGKELEDGQYYYLFEDSSNQRTIKGILVVKR